jgi:ribonuclease HII
LKSQLKRKKKLAEPENWLRFENQLWETGLQFIAGVDEAGRGPLAGPVFAAAVIFPKAIQIGEINDSKKLTHRQRERLFPIIFEKALAVGIGQADHLEIDRLNILQATFLAMNRALDALKIRPDFVLVDGNRLPKNSYSQQAIVKGDNLSLSIAAASIIAKVSRDRLMLEYDTRWPEYGFARHKGYPSLAHRRAIQKFGYAPIHRRSFHVTQLENEKK